MTTRYRKNACLVFCGGEQFEVPVSVTNFKRIMEDSKPSGFADFTMRDESRLLLVPSAVTAVRSLYDDGSEL